jgi:hypothetical protein
MRALLLALAMGATLAFTSCGGDSESSSSSTAAETSTEAEGVPGSESVTFTLANWDLLASSPEDYKGARVNVVGKVFTAPERDEGAVYFQMYADPKNSEWNTIVAYPDSSLRVRQDDFVRVKGEVTGGYTGENAFGGEVTAPTITADTVSVVDATAAASPATTTLGRATSTQHGITLLVRKVELADDETRVFLKIRNASSSKFSFYGSSGKAVQRGRQFESEYNSDYPELSTDLLPGASTSGVIVFPPLDPKGLTLHLEGSSDNYEIGDYGSLTWRFTWR